MSDLSDLSAAGISDVIPGHILSPLRLQEYGIASKEFAKEFMAIAAASAENLGDIVRDRMISLALAIVAGGSYRYGSQAFDAACKDPTAIPLLLWLSLQIKHPQMSRAEAVAFITPENQPEIRKAVLECAGFEFNPKKAAGKTPEPPQSTGTKSTESSAATGASPKTESVAA